MQGGAFGGLGMGAPAVSNPEEAFATQLTQLEVESIRQPLAECRQVH